AVEERGRGGARVEVWLTAAGLAFSAASCARALAPPSGVLTSVAELHRLPAQPPGAVRVRLRGSITYVAPTQQQAFLQDATGGVRLNNVSLDLNLGPGDVVELTGVATEGGLNPQVTREQVRVLATGSPLPQAAPLTGSDLLSNRFQYQ